MFGLRRRQGTKCPTVSSVWYPVMGLANIQKQGKGCKQVDYNKILEVSSQAGKIMLENGAEVYRVEETINRVCKALGAARCESFASPTAIVISVFDNEGQIYSVMRRITSRTVNLDKVDAVNWFSRQLESNATSVSLTRSHLDEIDSRTPYSPKIMVLASALAAGAFAIVFSGNARDAWCSLITGALVRSMVIMLQRIRLNDFFINLAGGAMSALSGWLWSSMGAGPHAEIITISSLMLLVPGLLLTNGVRDIAAGDIISGTSRIIEAFFIATALACGAGLVYTLVTGLGGIWL